MKKQTKKQFVNFEDIDLEAFKRVCGRQLEKTSLTFTKVIQKNIPLYQGEKLREIYLTNPEETILLKNELHHILKNESGVIVIKKFYSDLTSIDKSNISFQEIIANEKNNNYSKGDHFASPNANDRIWNSFEKVCLANPEVFFHYYKNPLFNLVHEVWLGPYYEITAQVNIVKPGGKSQVAHRDYHLGFQSNEVISGFPLSMQIASQLLTLQGAIAHCDMPLASGPTYLLPFSQLYDLGYLAFRDEKFIDYCRDNFVQLPLEKGDAIFFNPALFHAAGENKTSSTNRIVNLIQTSSAFGKTMETVDRITMLKKLYPILLQYPEDSSRNFFIKNIANGYAFPTNLDKNPPLAGNAPASLLMLVESALKKKVSFDDFIALLDVLIEKNLSN